MVVSEDGFRKEIADDCGGGKVVELRIEQVAVAGVGVVAVISGVGLQGFFSEKKRKLASVNTDVVEKGSRETNLRFGNPLSGNEELLDDELLLFLVGPDVPEEELLDGLLATVRAK